MIKLLIPLLLTLTFTSGCAHRYETLQALSGEYDLLELDESAGQVRFSVSLKLTDYESNADWPPAAYVGVYQGRNTNDSVQFFIAKDRPEDEHVVAGYRVIEFGEQIKRVNLLSLASDKKAEVHISFDHGLVTMALNGGEPVSIATNLDSVKPYISVSSGTAKFAIDSDKS